MSGNPNKERKRKAKGENQEKFTRGLGREGELRLETDSGEKNSCTHVVGYSLPHNH